MNDDQDIDFPNDDLDRVIRAALTAESDRQCEARLEQYWRAQSRKDRWQRRAYFALSAAAAAVILIGFLMVAKKGDERAKTASTKPERAPLRVDAEPVESVLADEVDREASSRLAGRAPTEYERFMFIARTGKPTSTTAASKIDAAISRPGAKHEDVLAQIEQLGGVEGLMRAARQRVEPKLCQATLARLIEIGTDESLLGFLTLVRHGSTRPVALAAADAASQLPLDPLLAFLDHEDKLVRRSAAMVLGHVNGPEVTKALIARVTEEPSGATEAWMALMACDGETAEEFMAYAARRPQLLGHLNGARVQWAYMIP